MGRWALFLVGAVLVGFLLVTGYRIMLAKDLSGESEEDDDGHS